ncbi:hypothetical protein J6590_092613, partial [Homalodisca vitripennis]
MTLGTKLTFCGQTSGAAKQMVVVTASLSRLMKDIGETVTSKRKLLMSFTQSVLQFRVRGIGRRATSRVIKKNDELVQRKEALRIASAYQTVSEPRAGVVMCTKSQIHGNERLGVTMEAREQRMLDCRGDRIPESSLLWRLYGDEECYDDTSSSLQNVETKFVDSRLPIGQPLPYTTVRKWFLTDILRIFSVYAEG